MVSLLESATVKHVTTATPVLLLYSLTFSYNITFSMNLQNMYTNIQVQKIHIYIRHAVQVNTSHPENFITVKVIFK